jgi:hypothetical protein
MMSTRTRKIVLLLLAALLLLPVSLYWLADAWLESSGGRQLLENELSARLGMNVRLEGEFDLMLLPDIGVSGTDLVIGREAAPAAASFFANSREFEVSVALRPLFRRAVIINWIRLTGGRIYPDRYAPSGSNSGSPLTQLPEIRQLVLRDFEFVLGQEDEAALRLQELQVSDFAEGRRAGLFLEIEELVTLNGWLLWNLAPSRIELSELEVDLAGQQLFGKACLLLQQPRSLNLDFSAAVFDLDAFQKTLPETGGGGTDLPLEIRARLSVDELSSSGVIARGVLLNLGQDPVCE